MPRVDLYNRCVEFDYADADGVLTHRKANLNTGRRPATEAFWYVDGFCHLRRETRTFRSDRMMRLFDGRAGWSAVPNATNWLEGLWRQSAEGVVHQSQRTRSIEKAQERALRQERIEIKRERKRAEREAREEFEEEARSIINQHFHALRVLLYVAKADKAFRAAERRLFAFFFTRVAGHRMDTEALRAKCMTLATQIDTPSTGQFHYSVRQLAPRLRTYRMAVCATARAMINSDRAVAPYELEVLDYLVRKLRPLDN